MMTLIERLKMVIARRNDSWYDKTLSSIVNINRRCRQLRDNEDVGDCTTWHGRKELLYLLEHNEGL